MSELNKKADFLESVLKAKSVEKYAFSVRESEKQELNTEGDAFKLMRTVFGGGAGVTVFAAG